MGYILSPKFSQFELYKIQTQDTQIGRIIGYATKPNNGKDYLDTICIIYKYFCGYVWQQICYDVKDTIEFTAQLEDWFLSGDMITLYDIKTYILKCD